MNFSSNKSLFISEISSNHNNEINRCKDLIDASAESGCDGVKFQLFKIRDLFSKEALNFNPKLLLREKWELKEKIIPELYEYSKKRNLLFSCTPFYLDAVDILDPYVDFFKIASYELLWKDLFIKCAFKNKPIVFSVGMAIEKEIIETLNSLKNSSINDIVILHCNSSYPTPINDVNLSVINTLRKKFENFFEDKNLHVGYSDHSVIDSVILSAVMKYNSKMIEFHIDLEGKGFEFNSGHCWLPNQIKKIIDIVNQQELIDGESDIITTDSEKIERGWRADPSDGLRPLLKTREKINEHSNKN